MTKHLITVAEAEAIILTESRDFGTELVPIESSLHRVLAEDISADRDMPPYDRATMDGIAIPYTAFAEGQRSFRIRAVQAAGETPINITSEDECVEIMTGAALSQTVDTVVRYEDLKKDGDTATVLVADIKQGQNIHSKGTDKNQGEIVAAKGSPVTTALVGAAASFGKTMLSVKRTPRIAIITTGNELVDITDTPSPYQIRRSNSFALKAVLQQYGLSADLLHVADDLDALTQKLRSCLGQYDALIITGGVSAGAFDYLPQALEAASVPQLFHGVKQKPGKPFWFGKHSSGSLVFAFPGNPVSAFMCMQRFFIPWLGKCLSLVAPPAVYATLTQDVVFGLPVQYFLQVKLQFGESGQIMATPVEGHGSGDFINLLAADAFMELPTQKDDFRQGEQYRVWPLASLG